ncbi:MAG: hypothetical protein ACREOZ_00400 [Gloeomargaritales cyanobacterium]
MTARCYAQDLTSAQVSRASQETSLRALSTSQVDKSQNEQDVRCQVYHPLVFQMATGLLNEAEQF